MLIDKVFSIQNSKDFELLALQVFQYQYTHNHIYQRFCNLLGISKTSVKSLKAIPYLPIEFFKKEQVISSKAPIKKIFSSSGTTGNITSKHFVTDLSIYEQSFIKAFTQFYGAPSSFTIIALLPSYMEREGSSLIYMTQHLIDQSKSNASGFYLDDYPKLISQLKALAKRKQKTLLIGVSFALLDLLEYEKLSLGDTIIVMETGGMKGRRKELIRKELHQKLKNELGIRNVHSEYGMTELLSQAYSQQDGIFYCPPWMKVTTRDAEDPLTAIQNNTSGGINIIDLANLNSCAFIATQDLGKVYEDGSFEILGRFDHSDIRGCNLMAL